MHPEILSITLFGIVAAFTPGPNNFVAFYSGFNFGIKKTMPHIMGVTLGFPFLLLCLALGLINIFKLYPLIQEILKYLGTLFLIYLAYKISFSGSKNQENKNKNPVKFIETFIKPKATHNNKKGKPKVTPMMCGRVLVIPKLNPE